MSKRLDLYDRHVQLGARMVDFAGFQMPLQYKGIISEHKAVRSAVGLFDVSHMGEVFATGPNAGAFVQNLVTNDISRLKDKQALYTAMCNEEGGILDDLLVYRFNEAAYMLVINASNIDSDYEWMEANNSVGAALHNTSELISLLALQGPLAESVLQKVTDIPLSDIPYYHFVRPAPGSFFDCEKSVISRTGYTGSPGFEIYAEREAVNRIWDALLTAGEPEGIQPAGLGARDTLRLEAGFSLYGNELNTDTNPYEARLGWVTKLLKGPFIGREALKKIKVDRPKRMLVGLQMEKKGIPRQGYRVMDEEGNSVGTVTSGSQSPMLRKGIALAFVTNEKRLTSPGTTLFVEIRKKLLAAQVIRPPFYKP